MSEVTRGSDEWRSKVGDNQDKMTMELAEEIRDEYGEPYESPTQEELSDEYGVSQVTISNIINRKHYVPDED